MALHPKGATGLNLACWNIRTMLDKAESNRPQRRSALVAHELSRLNIDIAALSEIRFPNTGSLKEQGAGYTLYWSGKPQGEGRLSGVGFMIKNTIVSKLENLPTCHCDRIISMRLYHLERSSLSPSSACMPQHFKRTLGTNTNYTQTCAI